MSIPKYKAISDGEINIYHFTPQAKPTDPVAVFTHPTGFTSAMYSCVVAHLRGVNAFGIDIRSHGLSQRADVSNWENFGKDLEVAIEKISTLTKTDQFIGIGISSGSSAHILNAAKFGDLYSALFLCEPILFKPGSDLASRDFLANSARNRRDTFSDKQEVYSRFSQKGPLSKLSKSSLALYSNYGFRQHQNNVVLSCDKYDEEAIYLSGGGNGVYEALEKITAQSLIVYGQKSDTINESQSKEISDRIKNSSYQEMVGVGHFTLYENPVLGAKMIMEFLSDLKLIGKQ